MSIRHGISPFPFNGWGRVAHEVLVQGTITKDNKVGYFDPVKDFILVEEVLLNFKNIRLIIIDPIVSIIKGDMHRSNEVRKSFAKLLEIAEKYKCAVVGITHFSKIIKKKMQ